MSKIVVVGAGASGIIAALQMSKENEVILLDGNDKIGKKILLTGNGRCNYWNSDIDSKYYETDCLENLEKIITKENCEVVFNYLENIGIYPRIKDNYYYPYSNQATSIREIFEKEIKYSNIKFKANYKVKKIENKNNQFTILSENNEEIIADKVILTTGSKAYSKTGSDGSGYALAASLGHTINPVTPALTNLHSNETFLKDWENIRCDARVSLLINGNKEKEEIGEIQLTKIGISGIPTFNISGLASKSILKGNKVNVEINFFPKINISFYDWLEERNNKIKNKTIEELLESIFHYKLLFVLCKKANISKDKNWNELTENEKRQFVNTVEKFNLEITETGNFEQSQVCTGGVSLKEINPYTMESLLVKNLYFAGEILDVDGICGGYNLAFAFISGLLAGRGSSC